MSDKTFHFDVEESPRIRLRVRSGDITVRPSSQGTVSIKLDGDAETIDETNIEATSDAVSVRTRSEKKRWFSQTMDVDVAAPPGSSIRIHVGSGDVVIHVPTTLIDVNSGSGDILIDEPVDDVRIKIGSGNVSLRARANNLHISCGSGTVRAEDCGDCTVNTASGPIELGRVDGSLSVKTASGRIRVHRASGQDVRITSMSGDVTVGLAPGLKVDARITTLSGDFRNDIVPTGGKKTSRMVLLIKSFSGSVRLRPPW